VIFESQKFTTPTVGVWACLALAQSALNDYPRCKSSQRLFGIVDEWKKLPEDDRSAKALELAIKKYNRPTNEELENRSPAVTYCMRTIWSCIQALHAEARNDVVRAWRCIASAAFFAAFAMTFAYHKKQKQLRAAKAHAASPIQEAKLHAKEIWLEWKAWGHRGKKKIRTTKDFARVAMSERQVLTSEATLVKWSSEWSAEARRAK